MTRRLFHPETGTIPFEIPASWTLFMPREGSPPEGGWPLVVYLHGQGMTSEQFALILNDLLLPGAVHVFPQGVFPFEIRSEGKIRIGHAWYLYDGNEEPFRSTLAMAESHVFRIIEEVSRNRPINRERVYLVGFSMGAYLSYFVLLRNSSRFRGLIGIGGRMKEEFVADRLAEAKRVPILMVHGEKDRAVPLERAQTTFDTLKAHGFPVELRTFPVGHEIRAVEVDAMRAWLEERLSERDA